jgi:UDP-N-acetyl-D-glucosamine dehydrogenase
VAEHRLSLAVNGRESLLHQKLITHRAADGAGAGQRNGRQGSAGSVAIVGLGYVGLPTAVALHGAARRIIGIDLNEQRLRDKLAQDADLGGPDRDQFFGAAHRAVV